MAIDPICGMTVDETSPLRAERDGQTFYFCSEHCRKKFVGQTHRDQSHAGSPIEMPRSCERFMWRRREYNGRKN